MLVTTSPYRRISPQVSASPSMSRYLFKLEKKRAWSKRGVRVFAGTVFSCATILFINATQSTTSRSLL